MVTRSVLFLTSLWMAGCGAKSDLGSAGIDGGVALAPELIGVWWFHLASGAPRYYVLALCPDGRAGLVTSFEGAGGSDTGGPVWGNVRPSSGDIDAIAAFDSPATPGGFSTMTLRYDRASDTLLWLEEAEVFAGWASGGGLRDRYGWASAAAAPSCD